MSDFDVLGTVGKLALPTFCKVPDSRKSELGLVRYGPASRVHRGVFGPFEGSFPIRIPADPDKFLAIREFHVVHGCVFFPMCPGSQINLLRVRKTLCASVATSVGKFRNFQHSLISSACFHARGRRSSRCRISTILVSSESLRYLLFNGTGLAQRRAWELLTIRKLRVVAEVNLLPKGLGSRTKLQRVGENLCANVASQIGCFVNNTYQNLAKGGQFDPVFGLVNGPVKPWSNLVNLGQTWSNFGQSSPNSWEMYPGLHFKGFWARWTLVGLETARSNLGQTSVNPSQTWSTLVKLGRLGSGCLVLRADTRENPGGKNGVMTVARPKRRTLTFHEVEGGRVMGGMAMDNHHIRSSGQIERLENEILRLQLELSVSVDRHMADMARAQEETARVQAELTQAQGEMAQMQTALTQSQRDLDSRDAALAAHAATIRRLEDQLHGMGITPVTGAVPSGFGRTSSPPPTDPVLETGSLTTLLPHDTLTIVYMTFVVYGWFWFSFMVMCMDVFGYVYGYVFGLFGRQRLRKDSLRPAATWSASQETLRQEVHFSYHTQLSDRQELLRSSRNLSQKMTPWHKEHSDGLRSQDHILRTQARLCARPVPLKSRRNKVVLKVPEFSHRRCHACAQSLPDSQQVDLRARAHWKEDTSMHDVELSDRQEFIGVSRNPDRKTALKRTKNTPVASARGAISHKSKLGFPANPEPCKNRQRKLSDGTKNVKIRHRELGQICARTGTRFEKKRAGSKTHFFSRTAAFARRVFPARNKLIREPGCVGKIMTPATSWNSRFADKHPPFDRNLHRKSAQKQLRHPDFREP
uniref:Uncharacterized protein n=1 Tax=Fagus sylvatica TaxID=28930 RepID=A0A2N9FW08_FAGSY